MIIYGVEQKNHDKKLKDKNSKVAFCIKAFLQKNIFSADNVISTQYI